MTEVQLTRAHDDRRRFDLDGFGSVRRTRWLTQEAELRTREGAVLTARQKGFLQRAAQAVDRAGGVVGEFRQRKLVNYGGDLTWAGVAHEISSESAWRTRYLVSRDGAPLLSVLVKGWGGRTPAVVTVSDPRVDAGLALFAVWLVRVFAASDSSSAGAASG
jgi:hypothetical protein